MDKIKFFALLLLVAFGVQHVQIQQERENWRQFCIQLEADKAHAVVPVALAAAAPYVLAGLVAGTTAIWCYMHGGKEAIIQFTGVVLDGVPVTKAWIQEKIAQLNGIDTSSNSSTYSWDQSANTVVYSGKKYTLGSYVGYSLYMQPRWAGNPPVAFGDDYNGYSSSYYVGANKIFLKGGQGYNSSVFYYWCFTISSDGIPWSGFNPDNYPQLYTGPALLSNCHAVAQQNPNLWLLSAPPIATRPASYDPTLMIPVPIAAQLASGALVDQRGRRLPPPPPGVVPGLINPPVLDPDLIADLPAETPQVQYMPMPIAGSPAADVIVPKDVRDQLINGGVLVTGGVIGGTINGLTNVGGNVSNPAVQWTDASGVARVTPISQTLAAQLAGTLPVVGAIAGSPAAATINPGQPETDPGNPEDISLPVVPDFDPSMDWGEEEPWPWAEWIAMLPFIDVLQDSSLNLSSASPVISFQYSMLGTNRSISYDFSQWELLINAMGFIIYACACWYALQLALLKRD